MVFSPPPATVAYSAPSSTHPDNNFQIICHAFSDHELTNLWHVQSNETNNCTHIILVSATLNASDITGFNDQFSDLIAAYKNESIKVGVALGSMNFSSLNERYSYIVRNETARAIFINNAFEFLRRHDLDGFELFWRYPNNSQVNGDDVEIFAQFVEQISHEFQQYGYFISAYVIYNYEMFNWGENIARFSKSVDWITSGAKDLDKVAATGIKSMKIPEKNLNFHDMHH